MNTILPQRDKSVWPVLAGMMLLLISLPVTAAPVKIMCLGDSITYGTSDNIASTAGYRTALSDALRSKGVAYQFVGSVACPNGPSEGHPGWTIQALHAKIIPFLAPKPDVILLMAGTNNLDHDDAATMLNREKWLIRSIVQCDRHALVYVASPTPLYHNAFWTHFHGTHILRAYADALPALVRSFGPRVRYVDLFHGAGFVRGDWSTLGCHPSPSGYAKMGKVWAREITPSAVRLASR